MMGCTASRAIKMYSKSMVASVKRSRVTLCYLYHTIDGHDDDILNLHPEQPPVQWEGTTLPQPEWESSEGDPGTRATTWAATQNLKLF